MSPPTRQAIQVAAASASAIALGAIIPPHQYFWALLSAFLMFNQTASASEARRRTIARIVGTVLGVAAGLIAIQAVHGKAILEASLALIGVFAALYVFRTSYWAFTFFITTVVAIVYELVGRPADQLLVERLVETLVGATCGGIVATFVFPLATKRVVAVRKDEFAERLMASSTASDRWSRSHDGESPLDAARSVDATAQELLARARPLGDPPEGSGVERGIGVARARRACIALVRWTGHRPSRWSDVVVAG